MRLFDQLFRRKSAPTTSPFAFLLELGGTADKSREALNSYTGWVNACVSAIADEIATIEFRLQKESGDSWTDIQYVYDVLGITDEIVLAQPAAYQVFINFDNLAGHNRTTKIFGTQIGPYGHVCVFVDGDVNGFRSFDANWPTGTLPHIQSHSYNGVLGWFHPKAVPAPAQGTIDSLRKQRDDNWNLAQG